MVKQALNGEGDKSIPWPVTCIANHLPEKIKNILKKKKIITRQVYSASLRSQTLHPLLGS
jgi:hypothetical protein